MLPALTLWPSPQGRGQAGACGCASRARRWSQPLGLLLPALPITALCLRIPALTPASELGSWAMPGPFPSWVLFLTLILLTLLLRLREAELKRPGSSKGEPGLCPRHWLLQLGSDSPPCPSTSLRWTPTGPVAWVNDKALGAWRPCVEEPRVQRLGAEPAGLGGLSLLFFLRHVTACLTGSENPPGCELCLPKTLERWCSVAPVETGSV